jgi:hypothetical protein
MTAKKTAAEREPEPPQDDPHLGACTRCRVPIDCQPLDHRCTHPVERAKAVHALGREPERRPRRERIACV